MSPFLLCQHLCAETTNALPSQVNCFIKLHIVSMKFPDMKGWGGKKEKMETEGENRSTSSNYDWPINGVGCQCQWAQLWTAGNTASGRTLLKRSSTVRFGHSPKVYMRSQGAWLTLAEENNKSSALYRLTLKTVPM